MERRRNGWNMVKKGAIILALLAAAAFVNGCGKMQDKKQGINSDFVVRAFLEAWKVGDWKTMYQFTHPGFIQDLRLQKLSPEQREMSDRDLFIHEFERARKMNPGMAIRTYEISSISGIKTGETAVWVEALINGKKKRIPLAIDGMSFKVDPSRIE
jgi:hypothetical protein